MWYKKLVRDGIPQKITANGEIAITRIMDTDEYRKELLWKLLEETREAIDAGRRDDAHLMLRELADLEEIIDTILQEYGLTRACLLLRQEEKRKAWGGFSARIFLVGVETRP
jgi:predicted house-cleaning noncanonical NTP pyrophosphatase (MazG superfamily)